MSRAGFADGMLKGMAVASHFKGLYDSTQERRELAGVDEATAQQSTGYTAKDGENLEALAGKGYKIDFDQNANAYTATNESGDKKSIPMQGVTDFLGKRSAGTLSSIDERQARQEAKADIVSRRNPERGMQMHAAIAQGVRTQKVAAREDKQWAKQDKLDGDMEAIDANLSQQFEASLLQEDGSKRAPTSDDYMGMTQNRAFQLAQRGHMAKSGEAMKEYHAQAHIKIQSENEARAAAIGPTVAAIHSGDMAAVAGFYNKFVPSGSKVTRIERTKEGGFAMYRSGMDGKEMEPMMFKSAGEAAALVQTVSNPNALYQYSQGEFTRMLQLRQDARAGESLGLQRENAVANRQERAEVRADKAALRKESIAAALELAKEENGGSLTEAQGRAIAAGIKLGGTAGGQKSERMSYDPAKVQKSFGETTLDRMSGKEVTTRNRDKEQEFSDFWANGNYRTTDEALIAFQRQESKNRQKAQAPKQAAKAQQDAVIQEIRANGVPEADIAKTMKDTGLTREEILQQLVEKGVIAPMTK